jgi:hypothetical protein
MDYDQTFTDALSASVHSHIACVMGFKHILFVELTKNKKQQQQNNKQTNIPRDIFIS